MLWRILSSFDGRFALRGALFGQQEVFLASIRGVGPIPPRKPRRVMPRFDFIAFRARVHAIGYWGSARRRRRHRRASSGARMTEC